MLQLYSMVLTLLLSMSVQANQLADPLDMPAQQEAKAIHSLMLDVAWAGNRLVSVGEYGYVLYSDDQGVTWQQAEVPVQVALTAVYFVNAQRGWAVGHDGVILHSDDNGETWAVQLDGRATGAKLLTAATDWKVRIDQMMDGELTSEEEEALSLQVDAVDLALDEAQREVEVGPWRPFMDVYFRNENEGYAVGAFGYFFSTKDGGKTWFDSSPSLPNYELLNLYGFTELASGELLIVGEFGFVLRSADGGQTWQQQDIGYEGSLFGVRGVSDNNVALAVGLRGNAFLSPDGGLSWRAIKVGKTSILDIAVIAEKKVIFVGLAGAVTLLDLMTYKTEDIKVRTRAHFASVASAKDGNFVLLGTSGIMRINDKGDVLPVKFNVEGAK
ncbi:MAG: YCF48-related protein [Pseudomonadales bacterium]